MDKKMELFIGRLGQNPDLRYTPKQTPVCLLSIAIDKIGEGGPIWKRVVVWGKQAELCSVQLKKVAELFVHGRNEVKTFTNKQGEQKTLEEIHARLVGFSNL